MSTAQPSNRSPILKESTQQCRLWLPSLTNLIFSVHLVPMTRFFSFTRWICLQRCLFFQSGIRFPRIQFVPKLELKHTCLQSAAKAQLPEYTPNPVPNCPIVQYQSPSVHFPRVPISNCRPSLRSYC